MVMIQNGCGHLIFEQVIFTSDDFQNFADDLYSFLNTSKKPNDASIEAVLLSL